MTPKMDDGPIVGAAEFPVPSDATPAYLLEEAVEAALWLLAGHWRRSMLEPEPLEPIGLEWGPVKTTRADFLAICRIPPDLPQHEVERRHKARSYRRDRVRPQD